MSASRKPGAPKGFMPVAARRNLAKTTCSEGHALVPNPFDPSRRLCLICKNRKAREWQRNNRERSNATTARYRANHREEYLARRRQQYDRDKEKLKAKRDGLRLEVLMAYGGLCECCGESEPNFLAIDHIDGGGHQHRKSIKQSISAWLKKNGYPAGFRVLCHNCNMALGLYGECPHTQQSESRERNSA